MKKATLAQLVEHIIEIFKENDNQIYRFKNYMVSSFINDMTLKIRLHAFDCESIEIAKKSINETIDGIKKIDMDVFKKSVKFISSKNNDDFINQCKESLEKIITNLLKA